MKSTLKNMIASLLGITMIASAGVGLVYQITEEPIAQAQDSPLQRGFRKVCRWF